LRGVAQRSEAKRRGAVRCVGIPKHNMTTSPAGPEPVYSVYPADVIAELLNLTPGRIRQLVAEGVIPRAERGKYDLIRCVRGYVRFLQERAEGRGVETSGVHAERTRLLTAQAERAELEVAALHRSLLPFDEVVAAWEQLVAACRARCLAIPSKLAPRLTVIHERRKIQDALTAEIREALQELARFDLPGPTRAAEGRRGIQPPAGANGKSVGRSKLALEPGRQRRARTIPVH
jgi:phage terminase Nu1 subunit (DNA packaging protein)